MRFKKAPLRATGGESNISEDGSVSTVTESAMSETMDTEAKTPRIFVKQELQQQAVGTDAGSAAQQQQGQRRRRSSSSYNSSSQSKDEETQAAQAKLRQYEALGLIKVEVDEMSSQSARYAKSEQPLYAPDESSFSSITPDPVNMVSLVTNSQQPNTFTAPGGMVFAIQQQPQRVQIVPQMQTHAMQVAQKGGSVVDVPALTDMEGDYGFSVTIEEKERTTKSPMWLMSKITNKLYTNINKAVPFEIRLKKRVPRDEFHVRAAAVFSSAQFLRTNVTRCPNHASLADVTNHDFPCPAHVVRADHPGAHYDEAANGRLSVVVPLDTLQDGSDYTPILLRFMCLGSCVGGINRRPIAIILTLENSSGQIFGRKVIDVRVCACPTRDIRTDEQTLLNKGMKRRATSQQQEKSPVTIRKKPKPAEPKIEPDDDKIYYIPVRGIKLYEFLTQTKEVYYRTHPEYASKYPDDTISSQVEDDSEDMKGNDPQMLGVGETEMVNWDSGGDSPQRMIYNNESQLDMLSGTKHNSPLSKLTPNISISPSPLQLRLFREDDDNDVISFSQEENLEYPSITKEYPSITKEPSIDTITNTQSACYSISSESLSAKSSFGPSPGIKNMDSNPKHIPVRQVQSYKPGSLAVKSKALPISKRSMNSEVSNVKGNKNSGKNSRGNLKYSSIDTADVSCCQGAVDSYMSPGSPEMLAANVLVEGFKGKTVTKQ